MAAVMAEKTDSTMALPQAAMMVALTDDHEERQMVVEMVASMDDRTAVWKVDRSVGFVVVVEAG